MQKDARRWQSIRLGAALVLCFFPCGILYPFAYPVPEILMLAAWICVFPTRIGCLSLLLLPLFPNESYGYSAFNYFCVAGTLATGVRAAHWARQQEAPWDRLHALARLCMGVSLALAAWQAIDGQRWLDAFPTMISLGEGRGGGLRTEPSLLALPLALYLSLVLMRLVQPGVEAESKRRLLTEAALIGLGAIFLTRSLTVAIVAFCFLPAFGARLKNLLVYGTVSAALALSLFWGRLRDAISGGDAFTYMITSGVSSWRSVPDIIILLNFRHYLLPPNPATVRESINAFAVDWNPRFIWLENTYSTFSAGATTIGLIATLALLIGGAVVGLRKTSHSGTLRAAWMMLYIADWFILPKYEASGWIALGMVTAAAMIRSRAASPAVAVEIAGAEAVLE
jgi:hypothetical protein